MSNMITDFGAQALLKGHTSTEQKLSKTELMNMEQMLNTMLFSMPNDTSTNGLETFSYNGGALTNAETAELIMPYIEQIRLSSIKIFEQYFHSNSNNKDPQAIVRDFNSGAQDARIALSRMCIFPLEAMNVRLELAHPELLKFNARNPNPEEKVHAKLIVAVIGDFEIVELEGPHLPPVPINEIVNQMQKQYDMLDSYARDIISGTKEMPTAKPPTMN